MLWLTCLIVVRYIVAGFIKTDQIVQHSYEYCSQYNCLLTIKTVYVVTVSHIFRPNR